MLLQTILFQTMLLQTKKAKIIRISNCLASLNIWSLSKTKIVLFFSRKSKQYVENYYIPTIIVILVSLDFNIDSKPESAEFGLAKSEKLKAIDKI